MRSILFIAALALPLVATTGRAGDDNEWTFDEFTIEGLDQLQEAMKQLQDFLDAVPRFEAPYIDEDGNIIIPRQPYGGDGLRPPFDMVVPEEPFRGIET